MLFLLLVTLFVSAFCSPKANHHEDNFQISSSHLNGEVDGRSAVLESSNQQQIEENRPTHPVFSLRNRGLDRFRGTTRFQKVHEAELAKELPSSLATTTSVAEETPASPVQDRERKLSFLQGLRRQPGRFRLERPTPSPTADDLQSPGEAREISVPDQKVDALVSPETPPRPRTDRVRKFRPLTLTRTRESSVPRVNPPAETISATPEERPVNHFAGRRINQQITESKPSIARQHSSRFHLRGQSKQDQSPTQEAASDPNGSKHAARIHVPRRRPFGRPSDKLKKTEKLEEAASKQPMEEKQEEIAVEEETATTMLPETENTAKEESLPEDVPQIPIDVSQAQNVTEEKTRPVQPDDNKPMPVFLGKKNPQIKPTLLRPAQPKAVQEETPRQSFRRPHSRRASHAGEETGVPLTPEAPRRRPAQFRRPRPQPQQETQEDTRPVNQHRLLVPLTEERSLYQQVEENVDEGSSGFQRNRVRTQITATTPRSERIFDPPLSKDVMEELQFPQSAHRTRAKKPTTQVPSGQRQTTHFPVINYGGSDLHIAKGEVIITEIGTVDDTPPEETQRILSGLGSRRRGLARNFPGKASSQLSSQTNLPTTKATGSLPNTNSKLSNQEENLDVLNQEAEYEYY